jgi:hypothetical protein
MAARRKLDELQAYKDRRRRQRDIHNFEERLLLDQIAEGRKQKPAAAYRGDRLPLAKDRDVRQLQIEVRILYIVFMG